MNQAMLIITALLVAAAFFTYNYGMTKEDREEKRNYTVLALLIFAAPAGSVLLIWVVRWLAQVP